MRTESQLRPSRNKQFACARCLLSWHRQSARHSQHIESGSWLAWSVCSQIKVCDLLHGQLSNKRARIAWNTTLLWGERASVSSSVRCMIIQRYCLTTSSTVTWHGTLTTQDIWHCSCRDSGVHHRMTACCLHRWYSKKGRSFGPSDLLESSTTGMTWQPLQIDAGVNISIKYACEQRSRTKRAKGNQQDQLAVQSETLLLWKSLSGLYHMKKPRSSFRFNVQSQTICSHVDILSVHAVRKRSCNVSEEVFKKFWSLGFNEWSRQSSLDSASLLLTLLLLTTTTS